MSDQDLIDLQEVAPAEVGEIDLYQRREKIYTRKIEGFFQRRQRVAGGAAVAAGEQATQRAVQFRRGGYDTGFQQRIGAVFKARRIGRMWV